MESSARQSSSIQEHEDSWRTRQIPVDDVDKTIRRSEASARVPVIADQRPHIHSVPVKPRAPSVERAKADASGKDPTMRFKPAHLFFKVERVSGVPHEIQQPLCACGVGAKVQQREQHVAAAYATSAPVIAANPA